MGTDIRRNTSGLIDDLVKNGSSYNVWQAIWIAENITKKDNQNRKDYLLEQTGLNFRPYEKYEYPPSDLKSVSIDKGILEFILTFMGLYGINSPLPRCYHDQVDLQQRIFGTGEVPLQNFLDIFNNRFYWLYYQSWKKYRFHLYLGNDPGNKVLERINSFSGRGFFTKRKDTLLSDFTLLKFSGLFSQRVRHKAGLHILLMHIFPDYIIKVKEFVPRWVELSDVPELGSDDNSLGKSIFIGKYTIDYSSRICIEIGPLSFEQYLEFLPGKENSNRLIELLQLYLNDSLEFDFAFIVKADSLVSVSWDDNRIKLGSTSWLGKPQKDFMNVYLKYEEILQLN